MEKKIRKAVRTFLIKDNNIIVIKYKGETNKDYYDIPGGKIEDKETSIQASVREFIEETGIEILDQEYKGHVMIEYPDRIFDFDVYTVRKYNGEPIEFEENYSMWKNIDELISEQKIFPSIEILKYIIKNNENNINLKILCNKNHTIKEIQEV